MLAQRFGANHAPARHKAIVARPQQQACSLGVDTYVRAGSVRGVEGGWESEVVRGRDFFFFWVFETFSAAFWW